MIGALGEDGFGDALLSHLKEKGVNTDGVIRVPGPSGVALISVARDGSNSIVVVPGANGTVTPAVVDEQADRIRNAGMVLCQLELLNETVLRVSQIAKDAGVPFILDPAPASDIPKEIWKNVTWVTPNETEAAFYLVGDEPEPDDCARQFLSKGVAGVILKRGSEGSYVAQTAGSAAWVPPFYVKAVDTVGAGDAYNGGFAVSLLEGHDPATAARFASAAAAISVTKPGAQDAMPTRAEVDALLATALKK
jgi:ribokinase